MEVFRPAVIRLPVAHISTRAESGWRPAQPAVVAELIPLAQMEILVAVEAAAAPLNTTGFGGPQPKRRRLTPAQPSATLQMTTGPVNFDGR